MVEKNEVAVQRQEVFRVSLRRGSRGKHVLIGLAIGAAAGAITGALAFSDNGHFLDDPLFTGVGAAASGAVGGGVSAGIGAALPAGNPTLYQAERRQNNSAP